MVSGVAHDFNNLLTGIVLCCDLLLIKLEKANPLRRYVEEMKNAAAQGATLIAQLLAVVREDPLQTGPVSWNDIVNNMRNLLSRLLGENIDLKFQLTDDLPPIQIDTAEAQQIVLNLALNARDAMPDGGRIQLATRGCNPERPSVEPGLIPWIEFQVTDSGCGMDEQVRESMFQPFFTTKGAGHGNGLGLATVKSIVDKYGGTIDVASKPGVGTDIRIGFPAARQERAA